MLEHAGRIFDEHAAGGTIELPYVTECFRRATLLCVRVGFRSRGRRPREPRGDLKASAARTQ